VTQPMPEQIVPPITDPGNPYIGQYPAALQLGIGQGPKGPAMLLTIRCGPATLTVLLSRDEAQEWAKVIAQNAALVSPLIIPTPANGIPPFPMPNPGEKP
jgi:hypothetical protein